MIIREIRVAFGTCSMALLGVCLVVSCTQQESNIIYPAKSLPTTSPWDLVTLSDAPTYEWADQDSMVRSLYYEGERYQGKPTRVFAYYASPTAIKAKNIHDIYPAVVLVHGGGGKAFKEWAELWAERGYAAIALDL